MSDWEALGAEEGVTPLVEALVDRFASDFIIGFLFEGRDLVRIKRHELELASAHLGGDLRYTGRPVATVHKPLRINRGHFRRRMAIVRTVLTDAGVDPSIVDRWVAAEQRLEGAITDGTDCVGDPSVR